ncbi:conserved hypothetical protein [Bradyrhizobium sp. ORS 375]|uniref:hypothetical protein n=1 Tax=Bradyrhizobium sp. (strain ORS 375) TaxID=566679 RepID=UPI00024059CA|nr:hypothetical protein [Bradyrhizobium sp. ORS 375]CCD96593.1 conserved hypothetical protein [Bradyrhizobium sp. ORS 375]
MSALTYEAIWRSISARIHGLAKAASAHAGFLAASNRSPYGADKELQRQCAEILDIIEEFQRNYIGALPLVASRAIDSFRADTGQQIRQNSAGDALLVRTILVKLIAFEAEFTYCLSDQMERVRSASELAFMHLQRLIVADEDYQKKWKDAYSHHETSCEKLGATHLLWHGIWAFKVDAVAGGKTDLVYQEPLQMGSVPVSLGLVLTEWKRVTGSNADTAYVEARAQAALYQGGVLGGLELNSHRYLVIVTERQIVPPADLVEGNVVYRHINIAVDPYSPSVAAKRM